jgi:hypothetical protein
MRKAIHSEFVGLRKGAEAPGKGGSMTTFFTESRKDRLIHERIHDPYKATCKPAEPSVCPVCNAVFKDGRWQWLESWPVDSHQVICQACQRIRDNYPAGLVTMSGDFIKTHKQEVLNLARQHEQGERAQHPLHRILNIEEHPYTLVVATTDIHLLFARHLEGRRALSVWLRRLKRARFFNGKFAKLSAFIPPGRRRGEGQGIWYVS